MNAENQLQENKIDNLTANLSKLEKAVISLILWETSSHATLPDNVLMIGV